MAKEQAQTREPDASPNVPIRTDTSGISLVKPQPIRIAVAASPIKSPQVEVYSVGDIRTTPYLEMPNSFFLQQDTTGVEHTHAIRLPPTLPVIQHALNLASEESSQQAVQTVEHRDNKNILSVPPLPAPVRRMSVDEAHRNFDSSEGMAMHLSDQQPVSRARPSRAEALGNVRQVQGNLMPPNRAVGESQQQEFSRQEIDFVPQESLQQTRPAFQHQEVLVPLKQEVVADEVTMKRTDGLVTLIATGAELSGVLRLIADHHNLNLVLGPDVGGPVTVSIRGAMLSEVLDAILGVAGFNWHQVGNLLYVTGSTNATMNPRVQGRTVQVYPLNYVSAADVEAVANRLLSPVGNAFITESATNDQRRTREVLIVEDTREAHGRIAQYIAQIDVAPKQVLVEAHVLQVALKDDDRHGINLKSLARLDGTRITLEGGGFADEAIAGPSLALRFDGTDMDGLIELIQQHTNSRTLASPKLSVVNHQEARIQIGQRLPYSVATTTQTSTIQSVEFLDVGIVLTVQPIITDDGNVLMTVLPKVSGGRITESGFPEEDTTELSTTILMPDGGGIVIGGLIREEDSHIQASVPGLSRVPMVGNLFKRRSNEHRRNELIIALVTHVLPDVYSGRAHELCELEMTLPEHAKRDLRHPGLQMHQEFGSAPVNPPMHSPEIHGQPILQTSKKPSQRTRFRR
ncbi:MAG: hypothetical protein WBD20_26400 [Pirellulaceae bacterium]